MQVRADHERAGSDLSGYASAPAVDIPTRIGETAASKKPAGLEASLNAFLSLSAAVTGVTEPELPARIEITDPFGRKRPLYEVYFERLRNAYPAELMQLLQFWVSLGPTQDEAQGKLEAELAKDNDAALRHRRIVRQVAKIWLLSTIDDPQGSLDKEKGTSRSQLGGGLGQHQMAMIYPLIGAPAPGYSNLPHGYWSEIPARFRKP